MLVSVCLMQQLRVSFQWDTCKSLSRATIVKNCHCLSTLPAVNIFPMHQLAKTQCLIDDLRKSRRLHSVSAYRHDLYVQVQACGCSAEQACFCWGYSEHVGKMMDARKQRQKIKASEMPIKRSLFVGNMQIG